MTKKEFSSVVKGMLCALVANAVGWLLAFCAGADKPLIRPGWGQGLLSNIPLGMMIIICLLIALFDDNWTD